MSATKNNQKLAAQCIKNFDDTKSWRNSPNKQQGNAVWVSNSARNPNPKHKGSGSKLIYMDTKLLNQELRGFLNKMTDTKYELFRKSIIELIPLDGYDGAPRPNRKFLFGQRHFDALVDTIWEFATMQPTYHMLLGNLCWELDEHFRTGAETAVSIAVSNKDAKKFQARVFDEIQPHEYDTVELAKKGGRKSINFKNGLIKRCQLYFEADLLEFDKEWAVICEKMEKDPENLDNRREEMYFTQKLNKEKDRMAANADFIAQLYKMSMLKDRIVMGVIDSLLTLGRTNAETKEYVQFSRLEADCRLVMLKRVVETAGPYIDKRSKGGDRLRPFFDKMQELAQDSTSGIVSSNVRFQLQDTIDLRERNWVKKKDGTPSKSSKGRAQAAAIAPKAILSSSAIGNKKRSSKIATSKSKAQKMLAAKKEAAKTEVNADAQETADTIARLDKEIQALQVEHDQLSGRKNKNKRKKIKQRREAKKGELADAKKQLKIDRAKGPDADPEPADAVVHADANADANTETGGLGQEEVAALQRMCARFTQGGSQDDLDYAIEKMEVQDAHFAAIAVFLVQNALQTEKKGQVTQLQIVAKGLVSLARNEKFGLVDEHIKQALISVEKGIADIVIDAPLAPIFLKQLPDIIESARAEAVAASAAAEKLAASLEESAKSAGMVRTQTKDFLAAFLRDGSAKQFADAISSKIENNESNLASVVETIVDEGMRGDASNHVKIGALIVELVQLKALDAGAVALGVLNACDKLADYPHPKARDHMARLLCDAFRAKIITRVPFAIKSRIAKLA